MPAPLPALPPVFGVTDDEVRPGGRSMVDILMDDHHELAMLCSRLAVAWSTDPATAADVRDVLVAQLCRHLSAEQQYLYPTVRTVLPDGDHLADQELAEEAEILATLSELTTTPVDDPTLVNTVTRLVGRHSQRAARDIFPRLRERCTERELVRLGNRTEIAREAAPTRPHLSTTRNPPANKLVDPVVGVMDKVRDALTWRATRPADLDRHMFTG